MPPFDTIRSLLAAWRTWRWRKRVGPILAEIAEVDAEMERRRRQHRSIRALDRRKRDLKNRQIRKELSL